MHRQDPKQRKTLCAQRHISSCTARWYFPVVAKAGRVPFSNETERENCVITLQRVHSHRNRYNFRETEELR